MKAAMMFGLVGMLVAYTACAAPPAGSGPVGDPADRAAIAAGRSAWVREYRAAGAADTRSCTTCHGTDLTEVGRHVRTGKAIQPMAPSVNPSRLADAAEVEKWFRRNCRWTLGRECTPREKGDFIAFIRSQ